jgi:hypothetical protein
MFFLAVLGAALLIFTMAHAHESSGDTEKKTKNVVEKETLPLPPLYRLETIKFSVLRNGEPIAHVQFIIDVEVLPPPKDEKNGEKKEEGGGHGGKSEDPTVLKLSLVRQAFFYDLYGALAYLWVSSENPNVEVIRERLKAVVKKKFPDLIKDIYIRNFFINKVYE